MNKTKGWSTLLTLQLSFLVLLSACTAGSSALPTPAGQADGKPTLLYLWNFP